MKQKEIGNRVSVIIPAHNKANYTVRVIRSVLNQTHKNIEIIIIDDGSTDDTYKRLQPFFTDKVKYIYQHNQGASVARNRGIKEAIGEYIGLLDCDDMYLPWKIESSIKLNKDFVYTPAYLIDKNDKVIGAYRPKRTNLLWRNSICNSVVIKKKCFDKVGLFDESLFICADWDMWLRIQEHYELTYLDKFLSCYRI